MSYVCGGRPASAIGRAICHSTRTNVIGRKFFQIRCISWSYRNRGYDARIQRNKIDSIAVLVAILIVISSGASGVNDAPKNSTVERVFISKIFEYSAKKNKANGPAAYSTLKPETSSDSPSVRSNGARFVSASVEINHIMANGHSGSRSHVSS